LCDRALTAVTTAATLAMCCDNDNNCNTKIDVATAMGPAADNLQEYLQSVLDLCVRELHKHTEEIGRESYK
jgi:hypothetical protein